jgi:hypothetical protein
VDDIDSIATGMFRDRRECERHPGFKILQKEMKGLKRFLAIVANVIKHQQARIRIFSVEMLHADVESCMHGFFIEGVDNGIVGPSKVLHRTQDCFSLTTLAWEIIHFLHNASRSLRQFLESFAKGPPGPLEKNTDKFAEAVIAAARLPLYTFGEEHPFARTSMSIFSSSGSSILLESEIYGSIRRRWDDFAIPIFRQFNVSWEGDGSTKSFRMPSLSQVSLCKWS